MLRTAFRLALVLLPSFIITACFSSPSEVPDAQSAEVTEVDLGPTEYDASGTMPCSVGSPSFDEACGWRVLRDGSGGAEIWISNIASDVKPAYRVLLFSDGEFTTQDGTPLEVSKEEDMWTISVEDGGYFQFADAVITGG